MKGHRLRYLTLVKHAKPAVQQEHPANAWSLSEEGQLDAERLAGALSVYNPAVIVTSVEPKAQETGQIIATRLGRTLETTAGLHEHARATAGWLGAEEFERAIASLFASPDQLVFGEETADQARERFTQAVHATLKRHAQGNVTIVAHGTVISLFVAAQTGRDGYSLWRRLGLPSYVVLTLPDFTVFESVERLA